MLVRTPTLAIKEAENDAELTKTVGSFKGVKWEALPFTISVEM